MNSTRLTRTLAGLILSASGLALAAVATAPAHAAPVAAPARHCVTSVDTGRTDCYATFTAAIRAATGGRVTDAPVNGAAAEHSAAFEGELNAAAAQATQQAAQDRAARTAAAPLDDPDIVISIEYMDRDFGGDQQIWKSTSGCNNTLSDGAEHEAADVNWADNQISSYHGYAGCWVKHYENKNFGGASLPYTEKDSYIGSTLDDKTSSLRWS